MKFRPLRRVQADLTTTASRPAQARDAGMIFFAGRPRINGLIAMAVKRHRPFLAVKADENLRMWKDDRPTDITTKPLPDPDELNAAIPQSEWEKDRDGRPRPPWAHHVAVYLVNPETATKYAYCAASVGAHIAFEQLRENVATMRMLRNARVMPLVKLSSRPMKTKYKMSERPHFEIIGWHTPGSAGTRWHLQPRRNSRRQLRPRRRNRSRARQRKTRSVAGLNLKRASGLSPRRSRR